MKIFIYAPDPLGLPPLIECCQFVLDYFVLDNKSSRVLACTQDPDKSLGILSAYEPFIFIFYNISLKKVKEVLDTLKLKYSTHPKDLVYITSHKDKTVLDKLQEEREISSIFPSSNDYLKQDSRGTFYEYLVQKL
jgi:hypothetical protein